MEVPQVILDRDAELLRIVNEHPIYVPTEIAAKFLGMEKECLLESACQGVCSFAVGYKGKARYAKIPTGPFYRFARATIGEI